MSAVTGRVLLVAGAAALAGAWILHALTPEEVAAPTARSTDDRSVVGQRDPSSRGASPALDAGVSPRPEDTEDVSLVSVRAGHLTIDVVDQSLRAVLQQIADQAGMSIFVSDEVGDSRVSLRAKKLALDEGLKALLRDTDSFFLYGQTEASSQGIVGVWVHARGRGQDLAPARVDLRAGPAEIKRAPAGADPEERARSVEVLVQHRAPDSVPAVLEALEDEDAVVRSRALDAAVNFGVDIPESVLIQRAQFDPSPEVRFLALAGLASRLDPHVTGGVQVVNNADVRAISELALSDPSPEVQLQAQLTLQTLDAVEGVPSPQESEQSQEATQ
jgi:hypothetical protein